MRKGFTLIEILISAALSVVLLSAAYLSVSSLMRSYKAIDRFADSLDGMRISLERIITDVRNSKGMESGSSASCLVLDLSGKSISCDLNDGKIRMRINGTSSYLTEEGRVSFLKFSYPGQKLVMIEIGGASRVLTAEALARN